MKRKFGYFWLPIIAVILCSCHKSEQITVNCDFGKIKITFEGHIEVDPIDGHLTTLYRCYNAEECEGKLICSEYSAVGGYEAEWFQIIQNSSEELMINVNAFVKEIEDTQPGWIACKNVKFIEDDKYYAEKLSKNDYDLYVLCKNAAN